MKISEEPKYTRQKFMKTINCSKISILFLALLFTYSIYVICACRAMIIELNEGIVWMNLKSFQLSRKYAQVMDTSQVKRLDLPYQAKSLRDSVATLNAGQANGLYYKRTILKELQDGGFLVNPKPHELETLSIQPPPSLDQEVFRATNYPAVPRWVFGSYEMPP